MGGLLILAFVVISFAAMICTIVFLIWRGKRLGVACAMLITLSILFLYFGIRITNRQMPISDQSVDNTYEISSHEDDFLSFSAETGTKFSNSESIIRSLFKEEEGWTISDLGEGTASQMYFWIPVGKDLDVISDVITEANWAGKYDQALSQVDCDVFRVEKSKWDYGIIYVSKQGEVVMDGYLNANPACYLRLK